MSTTFFYHPLAALNAHVEFDSAEATHIAKALRMKSGDVIELTNGQGGLFIAELDIVKHHVSASVVEQKQPTDSRLQLHLGIAPTKNADRIEWLVEKAVELGVGQISLLNCSHSERSRFSLDRINRVAIAALKQSRRTYLPHIHELMEFEDWIGSIDSDQRFIAHCIDTMPRVLLKNALINDGAVCIIMTTTERARDLVKPPVLISGVGARDAFKRSSIANFDDDFWYSEIKDAGKQAYEMAGVKPEDVHSLMCYDNFSATVLFSLEGLGFCRRGESGAFVEGGALGLNGKLPTNTDGGHLSNSYMQGWALNVEAVRQLRGNCGERQVPGAEFVHYMAAAPVISSILYTNHEQ
jgi:RsmE family RNA methyltransferase